MLASLAESLCPQMPTVLGAADEVNHQLARIWHGARLTRRQFSVNLDKGSDCLLKLLSAMPPAWKNAPGTSNAHHPAACNLPDA
jgi:hypothetical protein